MSARSSNRVGAAAVNAAIVHGLSYARSARCRAVSIDSGPARPTAANYTCIRQRTAVAARSHSTDDIGWASHAQLPILIDFATRVLRPARIFVAFEFATADGGVGGLLLVRCLGTLKNGRAAGGAHPVRRCRAKLPVGP